LFIKNEGAASDMRLIHKAGWITFCGAMLVLMALPGVSSAAEHGGVGGMRMEGHGGKAAKSVGPDVQNGEKIFSGRLGPWMAEARLIDMEALLEQTGVSPRNVARFADTRHLMLFLTDPATGNLATGAAGKVVVTGPDKASSSMVTLYVMGEHRFEHIGSDVYMPVPGKYTFKAEIESGGQKGNVVFSYTLK
jgi:hypothetical protein